MQRLLAFGVWIFVSSYCFAETFEDFSYTTNELGATITGYSGTNSIVNIPTQVNGIAVTQIGEIWQNSVYPSPPIFGWYNTSVTSVAIPDTVTSIGEGALSYCNNLTSVTIGKNVTKIRDYTFQINPKLTNIIIPEGVTEIGLAAFHTCSELSTVRIPGSVTNIGSYAFINCTNLSRVEMLGNPPSHQTDPFANTTATIFFLSTASGWTNTFAGRPTDLLDAFRLLIFHDSSKGNLILPQDYAEKIGVYIPGSSVTIQAVSKPGYLFNGWSGSSNSLHQTITLLMDSNKSLEASFIQDANDDDNDGLNNYQEIIVNGTNPNLKDSNSDGVEDGQAVALGYNPFLDFAPLITFLQSNPPPGLYTTNQIYNLGLGGIMLNRNTNNQLVLNYQILQSTNLQNWSPYQTNELVISNAPSNKMFLRVQAVGQ